MNDYQLLQLGVRVRPQMSIPLTQLKFCQLVQLTFNPSTGVGIMVIAAIQVHQTTASYHVKCRS